MLARSVAAAGLLALGVAAGAAAAPRTQQVVLPGPVPYPTVSPPLVGNGIPPGGFTRYVFHIRSEEHVQVAVAEDGRPVRVRVRQRLDVRGKGDYQLAVGGPIEDVRRAPGSESEPGLRRDQVLWVGFSPGRKVLAADFTLRRRAAAGFLPVRLSVDRQGDGATLTLANATAAPNLEYAGVVRPREIARLLDDTRRAARADRRLKAAYATFVGLVRTRDERPRLEAPVHVEGELRVGAGSPVRFARTLGDGAPLVLRVRAKGEGTPSVRLRARPVPVTRLLQPPGARTWAAAVERRRLPAPFLLRRLLETRMRLVREDQYKAFLANPDGDGSNRIVYEYESVSAAPPTPAAPAPRDDSGGHSALVVALALGASLAGAGVALALWAHS